MQSRFIATIAILIILSLFISPALATNGNEKNTKDSIPGTDTGISIITDSSTGNQYAAGEVIVRYNYEKIKSTTLMNEYSTRINAKIGAVVLQDLSSKNLPGMQLVQIPNSISVTDAIAEYEKSPDVLYAEPNYIYYLSSITPDDPYFSSHQWGLQNTGQTIEGSVGTVGADINAPEAWDLTTGSNTVVVAVVDSGADYLHPDLSANMWINSNEIPDNGIDDDSNGYIDDVKGWNFYSKNNDPMDGNTKDETYHGTHCSGIIGAVGNNGIGISGVNWNVKIMPLRVTSAAGSLSTSDGILAINYASANGANVISNSWGGSGYSQALKDAIDNSPAVVVCAAGNERRNNENRHSYPSDYTSENLISVAATNNQDKLASFSNYGIISVDLGAPGVDIYSTKKNSEYQYMSGTSMATPFVSGVAALVKAKDPSLTNLQVRSAILNNVDAKSSLSGKVVTGGRMNAYKAVNSVGGGPTVTGISPLTGSTAGGTAVTITGTNFLGATSVKFGTTQAVFTPPVSATSITATSPAGTAGIVDVTVTTPSGTSATSAADKFTYVSAATNGSVIEQDATVFIGEGGLNVANALNAAQGLPIGSTPTNTVIGWWASAADIGRTAPTKSINLVDRWNNMQIAPADFVGYTGNWYVLAPDGQTALGIAFVVADPSLSIAVWDFLQASDVTGRSVLRGEPLGFQINTNMYAAVDGRYRSNPIANGGTFPNPATDGYITIKVKDANSVTYSALQVGAPGTSGTTTSLLRQFVNTQPWYFGSSATNAWITNATDNNQYIYPVGTYSAWAESTLNNMKENYKNGGADYTGKTVSATGTVTLVSSPATTSTIGVFRSGVFYLRNENSAGDANNIFAFGAASDTPIAGDWTGKGYDTVGVFRSGVFYLRNTNTPGDADNIVSYGAASGDWPIVGHWTTAQTGDTVGVFRSGVFYLRNTNTPGDPNHIFAFGAAGDTPIAGDWTGQGYDTVGVFRQGQFYLTSSNSDGGGDVTAFNFGSANDIPVIWKHDGKDTVGIFRSGTFYLKNENSAGNADNIFSYGAASDTPVDGKWI
jgi:subtilisin family serine protease